MRFDGWILGLGTASGTRVVVGHWLRSPLGPLSDVMVQRADGHRVLLAPTARAAEFIAGTYAFDQVDQVPVTVSCPDQATWVVRAGPLRLRAGIGGRPLLGQVLRAVPDRLATAPFWLRLIDPAARVLTGLRTSGSAGSGRREWYGVSDLHTVTSLAADWDGGSLGPLAPVRPPVTFGFGSTPARPSLARVRTTIGIPDPAENPR